MGLPSSHLFFAAVRVSLLDLVLPGVARRYISNRGHDTIACFSVDPTTGLLKLIQLQVRECVKHIATLILRCMP